MALRYCNIERTDENKRLLEFLNDTIDDLNTLLFPDKKSIEISGNTVIRDLSEGTYVANNVAKTYDDIPQAVDSDFTIMVIPAPHGTVQVLFSEKSEVKIYVRAIVNTVTTSWKEL